MAHFEIHPETRIEGNLIAANQKKEISITAPGSLVSIGDESDISGLKIEIKGRRNRLIIGRNCRLRGHILIKGSDQMVSIGDYTTFTNAYLLSAEGADITIGKWCMLSRQIEIRTTDAHSLLNAATGQRINSAAPIQIGDHVWIGLGAVINKGVVIGDDNVIGAGSFVNRSFQGSQCAIAGRPAGIVREGVTWHRSQRDNFTREEMDHWRNPAH